MPTPAHARAPRRWRAAIAGERRQVGVLGDVDRVGRVAPAAQVDPPVGGHAERVGRRRGWRTTTAAAMSTSMTETMYFVYG